MCKLEKINTFLALFAILGSIIASSWQCEAYVIYDDATAAAAASESRLNDKQQAVPVLIEVPKANNNNDDDDDDADDSDADEEPSASDLDMNFNQNGDYLPQSASFSPPALYSNQHLQPQSSYNTPASKDLKTSASYHHKKHGAKGWLKMGAWTGKKGSFGWHDKHPVGKGK